LAGVVAIALATLMALLVSVPASAAVSATNGPIVFQRAVNGKFAIFKMNPDGTHQVQLTNNPTANDSAPSVSGDGSHIVFNSDRDGNIEVYSMNIDGTNQTNLTNNSANDQEPQFNFDGSKIVFWSNRDATPPGNRNGNEIYVMNADGTNVVRLTTDQRNNRRPTFSPDGTKIAWSNDVGRNPGDSEIWTMNADGSNHVQLTFDPVFTHSTEAAFSPDGTHIAFSSTRNGGDPNPEIFLMNADGTNQTQITTIPKNSQATFSPDGTRIAFNANNTHDGNSEIYSMNVDGSNQTNLTNNPATDSHASWAIPQTTTTTLTTTPASPTVMGTPETLTATVTPASAVGNVQFNDGATPLGSAPVSGGTASITPTLPVGTHSLTAVFTPTNAPDFSTSTSNPMPYIVYATTTRTTLTVSPNPAFQRLPVFLIANVAPFNAAGHVQFMDGSTPLGAPVGVTAGLALFHTSALSKGTHSLTAVFTPNNPVAFGPSTSSPVSLTVRSIF
jgi:Tol biopolymer transport system component